MICGIDQSLCHCPAFRLAEKTASSATVTAIDLTLHYMRRLDFTLLYHLPIKQYTKTVLSTLQRKQDLR